jgi:cyclohexanone monooxygenase
MPVSPASECSFRPESSATRRWCWSERYATQPEILRYVEFVAAKFDLKKDIQLNTVLKTAYLNEESNTWSIEDQNGRTLTSTYFVMATGCLSTAKLPDIAGRDSFAGAVYHTAYWPHEGVDFAGKRVGVIGTGSSGTQLIPIGA